MLGNGLSRRIAWLLLASVGINIFLAGGIASYLFFEDRDNEKPKFARRGPPPPPHRFKIPRPHRVLTCVLGRASLQMTPQGQKVVETLNEKVRQDKGLLRFDPSTVANDFATIISQKELDADRMRRLFEETRRDRERFFADANELLIGLATQLGYEDRKVLARSMVEPPCMG